MRVIVVRHHRIDDGGFIEAAFRSRGAEVAVHLFPADGPLPDPGGAAHIVVLGADYSVYDEAIAHWMRAELDWLRAADEAGVPMLGICFGAQALAAALGGQAERAPQPEIGWTTVESLDPALISEGPWLEFHGDRCVPPPAARVLARTEVCVQAFSLGPHLAVQFHPEVDAAQLRRWMDATGCGAAARAAGQDPDDLLARTLAEEPAAAERADRLVAAALQIAARTATSPAAS